MSVFNPFRDAAHFAAPRAATNLPDWLNLNAPLDSLSQAIVGPYDGWSLDGRTPQTIEACLPVWKWLYDHYFRVQTSGWEHVPDRGAFLAVGSHNGGLAAPDMVAVIYDWVRRYGPQRPMYGLVHEYVWRYYPLLARLAVQIGGVRAHPRPAIAALKRDAGVLVYPGGPQDVFRPHAQRDRIELAGRTGFIKLALRQGVPIIPVVSWGAHDSLIVLAELYEPLKAFLRENHLDWPFGIDPVVMPIYLGMPWGLAFGPLPNIPFPTKVYTRIGPPIAFDRTGREAASDRAYVQDCYERTRLAMQGSLDRLIADAAIDQAP